MARQFARISAKK
jgi:hypothetical protein